MALGSVLDAGERGGGPEFAHAFAAGGDDVGVGVRGERTGREACRSFAKSGGLIELQRSANVAKAVGDRRRLLTKGKGMITVVREVGRTTVCIATSARWGGGGKRSRGCEECCREARKRRREAADRG